MAQLTKSEVAAFLEELHQDVLGILNSGREQGVSADEYIPLLLGAAALGVSVMSASHKKWCKDFLAYAIQIYGESPVGGSRANPEWR